MLPPYLVSRYVELSSIQLNYENEEIVDIPLCYKKPTMSRWGGDVSVFFNPFILFLM